MCGIAGIVNYKDNPVSNILNMNKRMYHRGPDAANYWLSEVDKVVFGHQRLAVLDLSENGIQPMLSANERFIMTYNGEIYNYKELEKKLQKDGCLLQLRGTSDTEVLLESFVFYGIKKTLEFVKGMFAVALFDRKEKQVYLIRDRGGEKPLYYGMVNGSFAFASDVAAIRQIEGFSNKINSEIFSLYFQYGYIPAPYTIYRDIYKLEPGKILILNVETLQYKIDTYWSMIDVARNGEETPFAGTEQEGTDELERILKNAIKDQMIADVPIGAFLSGGIDSALVVSLMQAISTNKVKTFTIGFEEDQHNEAQYAKQIAEHLGTEHTELYVTSKDAFDMMSHITECYAEPFADPSQIPTMLLSKLTRESVTVSLSGDAGDELFCGYNTYHLPSAKMRRLNKYFGYFPTEMRHLLGHMGKALANPNCETLYKISELFLVDTEEQVHAQIGLGDVRTTFLSPRRKDISDWYHRYPSGLLKEPVHNLMLMDMLQYHPDDILVKVDRAGMYYSLENRIPLLDRDVIEFAWKLPVEYKMNKGITKRVMRDILYQYVPKELMERPKKGFSVPLSKWMREKEMNAWATDILVDGQKHLKDIINQRMIESFWKEYMKNEKWTRTIWYILIMEKWLLENS